MCFIPVNFGASRAPANPHDGHAFQFSPAPWAELFPQAPQIADACADRNRFNISNFADDLKAHLTAAYFSTFFKKASPFTTMSLRFGSILR